MLRKILTMILAVLLLLSLSGTAYAQYIDMNRWGSFTLTLEAQGKPVVGAKFNVYFVAEATLQEDESLTITYTEFFADCGIPLDDPDLAEKLSDYVETHDVPTEVLTTDENGQIGYEELTYGLYLLRQTGAVKGFSTCSPFLFAVPLVTENEVIYDVDASPKTEVTRIKDINIQKVWLSDRPQTTDASVTIQLLRDGKVVETAVLNDANQWKITYENMPVSDAYSVKEIDAPKGYMPLYAQDGYDFTVYNMSVLIQTGQRIWPIPVLAMAGLLLMVAGVILLRKPGKTDA